MNVIRNGRAPALALEPLYRTRKGRTYCGRAEDILTSVPVTRCRGKVQLVFTSPPFPLNRKKRYGNLNGQEYVDWLASFAPGVHLL